MLTWQCTTQTFLDDCRSHEDMFLHIENSRSNAGALLGFQPQSDTCNSIQCSGNSHGNFQLHRFTTSENITKSFRGGLLFLIHTVVYFIVKRSIVDQMKSANILQQISTLSQSHSVDVAVAPFFAAKPQTWNNLPDNAVSMYSLPSFHWQSFPNVMFRLSYIFCTDRESIWKSDITLDKSHSSIKINTIYRLCTKHVQYISIYNNECD